MRLDLVRDCCRECKTYRLLLLAQTVQNFNLYPPCASSPGFSPFAWFCSASSAPSRPIVMLSRSFAGGGGGGGGGIG